MHSVRLSSHRKVRACCLQHGGTRKTYIIPSKTSQTQKGKHLIVHSDAESETAILSEAETERERLGTAGAGRLLQSYD